MSKELSPKEQAKELYIKIDQLFEKPYETHHLTHLTVKKIMSLIVSDMLVEFPSQSTKGSYEMERHLHWQEVKQEIENL